MEFSDFQVFFVIIGVATLVAVLFLAIRHALHKWRDYLSQLS